MSLVVFVMIDGVRPDALTLADCPTLAALRARGAWTLRAQSVMPSITLPCHMSIFHSVPPARHGVTTNDWAPMARPLPGLIEVAHAAGRRCAAFYNWEPLRDLSRPGSLGHTFFRDYLLDLPAADEIVVDEAVRLLTQEPFDFAFVYLGLVDLAGHAFGWMSDEYLAQLVRADATLGRLVAALPAESHWLVQSDHGGHERTHGTATPEDMTIFWQVSGPRIRQNHEIAAPVTLLDTAPTLARLLDLLPHREWEGRCVAEVFA